MNSFLQACASTVCFHTDALIDRSSPVLTAYQAVMSARTQSEETLYGALEDFHRLCAELNSVFKNVNVQNDSEELYTTVMEKISYDIKLAQVLAGNALEPCLVEKNFGIFLAERRECQQPT